MTRSDKDEYEGDNEACSETPEAESESDEDEYWIQDHAQRMEIGSAKNEAQEDISEDAKEKSSTLTQEQIARVRDYCELQYTFLEIGRMMGIPEGTREYYELRQAFVIANTLIAQSMNTQGSSYGQTHFGPKEANFEPYDPVHWEIAAQKASVDESPSEDGADSPITPDDVKEEVSESSKPAPTVPTSKPEFVRALKDSKAEQMMPYYKKGDILRVINKTSWGNLDDQRFEVLPLKPPGSFGRALIQDFEPADQAAVDAVGRAAWTEKERHSFRCAVDRED